MRSLVGKVLALQAGMTVVAVLLALIFFDGHAVKAALAAGFTAFIPAVAYARVVARIPIVASPNAVLLMHAIAAVIKLALTLALLVATFSLQHELSVPYFFGAYIACLMSYGLALLFK